MPKMPRDNRKSQHDEFVAQVEQQDLAWQVMMKNWLDGMPTVGSLQEALDPMLVRLSVAPEGQGFTVDQLKRIMEGTLNKMESRLKMLSLDGKYSVHHAGCLNIYTQDHPNPRWFKFMSRVLNDKAARLAEGRLSDDLVSCGKFIKLFNAACEALPADYIHRDTCWRGVNWVFPYPGFPARDKYFFPGRRAFFFTIRAFSTDLEVARRSAGPGLGTLFRIEPGCLCYKISAFSDFEGEKEVVFPMLDEFESRSTDVNIIVSLEHAENVTSSMHGGDPDIVHVKHIVRMPSSPTKADQIDLLQARVGGDFASLSYFFRNGCLIPKVSGDRAMESVKLVIQARDAMVAAVAEMVKGKVVVFLVGATGSGKSTLANWLVGNQVEIIYTDAKEHAGNSAEKRRPNRLLKALPKIPSLRITGADIASFAVGMDNTTSMTFLPRATLVSNVGDEAITLVDLPGFLDSTSVACRIGIDLAVRDLVNMARQAHVLALVEIASVVSSRGDGFKMQLTKLKRHFPKSALRLCITKSDQTFAGANEASWMSDAIEHLETICPELLDASGDENIANAQVLNINTDLIFNEDMTPQKFIQMLLGSDKVPPVQKDLNSDCLDRDIEDFTRQFQELGFLQLLETHFKNYRAHMVKTTSSDSDGGECNMIAWESLKKQTEGYVNANQQYAEKMRKATESMRSKDLLSIQTILKPIDELCNTRQYRLIGCFLAAEHTAMEVQQRLQIQDFKTLEMSAQKMREWLRQDDAKRVEDEFNRTRVDLNTLARAQGFKDIDSQINLDDQIHLPGWSPDKVYNYSATVMLLPAILGVAFCRAVFDEDHETLGNSHIIVPPFLLYLLPLWQCVGIGGMVGVGLGIYGLIYLMVAPGGRFSSEIADHVCQALSAIRLASTASQQHIAALGKLRDRVEAAKR